MVQNSKQRGGILHEELIAADGARGALRHAVVSPNVTGRTKERVAQSKRARTGLVATID